MSIALLRGKSCLTYSIDMRIGLGRARLEGTDRFNQRVSQKPVYR
jgi:hypothetical protein